MQDLEDRKQPLNKQPRKAIAGAKFLNNTDPNTLLNKFRDITSNEQIKYLEFLIAFFNPCGFNKIMEILKPHHKIRILIGIDAFKITKNARNNNTTISSIKEDKYKNELIEFLKKQIEKDANYNFSSVESIDNLLDSLKDNLELRIIKDKNVHAKIYLFRNEPRKSRSSELYEYSGHLITGSSNLSNNGLVDNYEFNVELKDSIDIESALAEFEELWESGIKVEASDIENATKNTYLDFSITIEDIYYKLLIEYFNDRIKLDSSIESLFSSGYKKPRYQLEAINDGIKKLEKYNGFFLSDVVGLGKTLIASIIAKKMIIENKIKGVLIICPPALKATWEEHLELVDLGTSKYNISSHDSLSKVKNAQTYELLIIDESHNFRNTATNRYEALQRISKNKKVILLSATPQNNSPKDLANQIYLFQDKRASSIDGMINLEAFFNEKGKEYEDIRSKLKNKTIKDASARNRIKAISKEIRERVLKHIMIRRTRSDLQNHTSYKDDLKEQNLIFPTIEQPKDLDYQLNEELLALVIKTLEFLGSEDEDKQYKFARYGAYLYLTSDGREKFDSDTNREKFYTSTAERLQHLMQMLLFKRFESSFYAFKATLKNQITSLESFIAMFEKGTILLPRKTMTNLDRFYEAIENEKLDLFYEENEKNLSKFEVSDFKENYLKDLKSDLAKLQDLSRKWEAIRDYDPKFDKFKKFLDDRLKGEQKIVVFSESKDTANYLAKRLDSKTCLCVNADNRNKLSDDIKANFDANATKQQNAYNLLISTDTLSEGVNMHRANIIINYDTPYNATRLMQRIGRINRIGTKFDKIFIYNFKPSNEGDSLLSLNDKIFQKLQSFHYTLGEDSAIYSSDEEFGTMEMFNTQINNDEKKFNRIKNLPSKIQSLISCKTNETYLYLKQQVTSGTNTKMIDYFYSTKIYENTTLDTNYKSSFIALARVLKDSKDLKPMKLNKEHFDAVKKLLEYHQNEMKKEQDKTPSNTSSSKKDIEAIRKLRSLEIDSKDREILETALKNGNYEYLAKEILDKSFINQASVDSIKEKYNLLVLNDTNIELQNAKIELSFSK